MHTTVSAVICTHDRPALLERALRSLHAQSATPHEIIVIDNAPSSDATLRCVRSQFEGVRHIIEPIPGLNFARNRAVIEASGDVVAFLDDDAVAAADWVANTARTFTAMPRLGVLTGHVAALGTGTPGEALFEANGGFARGEAPIHLSPAGSAPAPGAGPLIAWSISVGTGCSMAVRRGAVQDIGGFDEALDMAEGLTGGGDVDILWRLLVAGWDVRYEPAVRALHEHRPDVEGVLRQICAHNRGLIAWLTKSAAEAGGRTRVEVAAFLGWRLLKPGVRLARRLLRRDPLPAPALWRLWAQCWLGLADYPRARRLAARLRAAEAQQSVADEAAC